MPDPLEGIRSALGDRYAVERELGRGGNAVVYLARDVKHGRQVAIKVLTPELALSVRTERFFREIQISAQLTHPHILPLLDSGQAGEMLYYVMPYVEGESLRDRLKREKQLAIEDALAITRDVAEALGYAHSRGVVHRDIKPENILLSQGGAIVADFGIARALSAAGGQTVTATGVAVGTPVYMSPEQAGATGELDARSDIYSLACVVYEMLTGHPPYTGATVQEVMARHSLDPIPTVRAAREAVPEAMERAVRKALAKQPADRFATTGQFVAALDSVGPRSPVAGPRAWYLGGALAAILVALALLAPRWTSRAGPVEKSVAVFPFTNLTLDSGQAYFTEGMTEEIVNQLVNVEGLRVVPVTETYLAMHGNAPQEIGASLGVVTILLGTVRRDGSRVRVGARLVNVNDGAQAWGDTYTSEMRDVFSMQKDIGRSIVAALQVKLSAGDLTRVRRQTDDLGAYELYLKGRFFFNQRGSQALRRATEYFAAAIARDTTYALAFSGLADAYNLQVDFGFLPAVEGYPKALAAALRAVQLDDHLAEAHASLARLWHGSGSLQPDNASAEREYRRAISLDPGYALAHSWFGLLLARDAHDSTRFEEAITEGKLARQMDPLSPQMNASLGTVLRLAGRIPEAIESFEASVELRPGFPGTLANLGVAYAAAGELSKVEGVRDQLLGLNPRTAQVWRSLAYLYIALGRKDSAFAAWDQGRKADARYMKTAINLDWSFRWDTRYSEFLKAVGVIP